MVKGRSADNAQIIVKNVLQAMFVKPALWVGCFLMEVAKILVQMELIQIL